MSNLKMALTHKGLTNWDGWHGTETPHTLSANKKK